MSKGGEMSKTIMIDTPDPSVAWAEKLWERLHSGLLDSQKSIIAIIEAKAWEPLGYESFSKAWIDKMTDITIAVELRPHVVYEMFKDGLRPEDAARVVPGIGIETAKALKRQRDNGVPANKATTVVRQHNRGRPQKHWLSIELDAEVHQEWHRIAKEHNTTVADIAIPAIAKVMDKLK